MMRRPSPTFIRIAWPHGGLDNNRQFAHGALAALLRFGHRDIKRAFAMIEQRLQRVVKQWKPMLHSLMARAIATRKAGLRSSPCSPHITAPSQNGFHQGNFTMAVRLTT